MKLYVSVLKKSLFDVVYNILKFGVSMAWSVQVGNLPSWQKLNS